MERIEFWNKVFKGKENILTRQIAGETLLVPVTGNLANMQKIFVLNSVGAYIWQNLNGTQRLEMIRDGILRNFTAEKDQVDADVREFIAQLLDTDLITETA